MSLEATLSGATLLLYFLASIAYHVHLFAGSDRARRAATWLVLAGVMVHTGYIGAWCVAHRGSSILRDAGMPFSIAAYFIAILQVAVDLRLKWAALGSLALPLAFVAQFYAEVRAPASTVRAPAGSALLSPHVLAILLGFAAFALAFCLAVTYLVQARLLKTKQVRGLFSRLPPLESVSTGAHWLATIGFSMLTLGIITGVLAAPERWGARWYLDSHTVVSLIAWAIYAAYLAAIMLLGWRGRRTTYFLIAGFLVVVAAFFVTVGGGHHAATVGASSHAAIDPGGDLTTSARTYATRPLPAGRVVYERS
jgi:ABC-type uncharacterized transport system permease subunit